jgi:EAL domain-containing protein (putative c-di-GMP-specific phosphodiesterase class I)
MGRPPAWSVRGTRALRQPRQLIDLGRIEIVLQPIVSVTTGAVVAAEALARFPSQHNATVESVFSIAYAGGWGPHLEAVCLDAALQARTSLPAGAILTVNVSPDALQHPSVRHVLRGDLTGIAVEVTEKSATDSEALAEALADIRERGGRIAVDDATTGYAGLLRLTTLKPDLVKLDRGLITGARDNDVQAVVIEALVSLARRIGARTLGEGVETLEDLAMLAELDVDYAQGWAVGRPGVVVPAELPEVADACRAARRDLMLLGPSQRGLDRRGTAAVTAALAGSTAPQDVGDALAAASADLGVDVVGLSTLTADGILREITTTGGEIDPRGYAIKDYPATQAALLDATMMEAHVSDPHSDPAERALLERDGFASLLLTPVIVAGEPLGVLEFSHLTHHQWTRRDIAAARTVAAHIASVLKRMRDRDPVSAEPIQSVPVQSVPVQSVSSQPRGARVLSLTGPAAVAGPARSPR